MASPRMIFHAFGPGKYVQGVASLEFSPLGPLFSSPLPSPSLLSAPSLAWLFLPAPFFLRYFSSPIDSALLRLTLWRTTSTARFCIYRGPSRASSRARTCESPCSRKKAWAWAWEEEQELLGWTYLARSRRVRSSEGRRRRSTGCSRQARRGTIRVVSRATSVEEGAGRRNSKDSTA